MAANTAARPHLLGIPPELRNSIYALLLQTTVLLIDAHGRKAPQPALLRTCRQLRAETTQMYYTNTFLLHINSDATLAACAWLRATPAENLQRITAVHIETDKTLPANLYRWHCLGVRAALKGIRLEKIGLHVTRYRLTPEEWAGPPVTGARGSWVHAVWQSVVWRQRVDDAGEAERSVGFKQLALMGCLGQRGRL